MMFFHSLFIVFEIWFYEITKRLGRNPISKTIKKHEKTMKEPSTVRKPPKTTKNNFWQMSANLWLLINIQAGVEEEEVDDVIEA